MRIKKGFVVVVNNSWYAGFIPFYIYFALRANPDAHVYIFFRGVLSNKIREQLKVLFPVSEKEQFTIFENYKFDYCNDAFTTKALRWTIKFNADVIPEYLYIGDVDIILANESVSLFEQHIEHLATLKLPYSNVIRGDQKRITGLHFIKTREYVKCMHNTIEKYDHLLKQGIRRWNGSNEKFLYNMLNEINLLPETNDGSSYDSLGYNPKLLNFRPHHGVHLGAFRGVIENKPLEYLKYYKSPQYLKYFIDLLSAFDENLVLYNVIDKADYAIKIIFRKALLYAKQLITEGTKI